VQQIVGAVVWWGRSSWRITPLQQTIEHAYQPPKCRGILDRDRRDGSGGDTLPGSGRSINGDGHPGGVARDKKRRRLLVHRFFLYCSSNSTIEIRLICSCEDMLPIEAQWLTLSHAAGGGEIK
jgi:hypothetical protein